MKLFVLWIKSYPFKAMAFLALSIVCGGLLGLGHITAGFILLALCYSAFVIVYTLDVRRFLSMIVAVGLLAVPSARAQRFEPAAPLVIGGIVIIVGAGLGFVGCKIVKRCKNIVRGRTNAEPEELQFQVAGETGEYGAAFLWTEPGYCEAERLLPVLPTVFTIDIAVESVSNATVTVSASTGFEFVQSWGELQEELESHGLTSTAGLHFERNRHPVPAEQVPLSFDFGTRTVTIGSGGVLVTVERSADLREWEPLMALNVEAGGKPLRIEDASSGACFYRVTTKEP